MKRLGWLIAILAILAPVAVYGQGAVLQGGPWTLGHGPMYTGGSAGQPFIQDSGSAAGGPAGLGLSEFLMIARGTGVPPYVAQGSGPLGTNWCSYDAPTTNSAGYHYLCMSPNASGGAIIATGAAGAAPLQPLCFIVNGIPLCLGGGSGSNAPVTTTTPTTTNAVTCWVNTVGQLGNCAAGAATLFGSPTVPGIPAPFTIQGLVARGAPDPTNDKIPVYDNASGTIKYVTPSAIATSAVAGVSSIGAVSGVITLGPGLSIVGQQLSASTSGSAQGRLTLASTVPVMGPTSCASAACTNKTTIYYDCYNGCSVPIYTGSAVLSQQITGGEVADALASSGNGVTNAADVFDEWWVQSGNGTTCHATNGAGGGWSADTGGSVTSRGTGYTQLARPAAIGFLVNANSITHCYNGTTDFGPISASRATYLGTFYANLPGTVSYTFGSGASGGGAALFGLWNYYNRVIVTTSVVDTVTPYTYLPAVFRSPNNSSNDRIEFILGVAEDSVSTSYSTSITTAPGAAPGAFGITGVGFDVNNASSCQAGLVFNPAGTVVMSGTPTSTCAWSPTSGLHNIYAVESGDGTFNNKFNASSLNNLSASLRM
jgi:hypothetical protein